jgi:hypothetical protein
LLGGNPRLNKTLDLRLLATKLAYVYQCLINEIFVNRPAKFEFIAEC